ncbi:MAG: M48 family metallopeptidase [Roseibacillus sp.]
MMRKALPFALCGVIFAFAASCVAPAPAVDRQGNVSVRPASQSIRSQGLQLFEEIKRKKTISHNPTYNGQLQRVATRLQRVIQLPGANWEFVVFQDRTPNAFALPGGKVGVHTGLFQIAQTDAQLATVVAHEIAHVTSNHAQDRVSQQSGIALGGVLLGAVFGGDPATQKTMGQLYGIGAQLGIGLPFSRNQELEADRIGMIYMAKAGYPPREAITLWERFGAHKARQKGEEMEFLRTHPLSSTRIRALQQFLPVAQQHLKR